MGYSVPLGARGQAPFRCWTPANLCYNKSKSSSTRWSVLTSEGPPMIEVVIDSIRISLVSQHRIVLLREEIGRAHV